MVPVTTTAFYQNHHIEPERNSKKQLTLRNEQCLQLKLVQYPYQNCGAREESQVINQHEHRGTRETPCLDSSEGPASKDVRGHYAAPVTVPSEERARVRKHRHTTTLSFIVGDFQHTK